MLKPPYDAVPQTSLPPEIPLAPSTPGTPQYNDRLTQETHPEPDNCYTPVITTYKSPSSGSDETRPNKQK
ncbi:hypothetical protein BPOR_0346g00020 [Botrytis porri]|uniref:Uncharacterized protein n=1 Tax=Botrytis porri TaxID=87229 RepID=A0A4Z1KIU0_9HELO|nr:hypothetical protein BPOR_0346g00020 [Botrytis porri]